MTLEPNQEQASDLEVLATARFPNFSAAEIKILNAASKGDLAICGPDDRTSNPANDPRNASQWGQDRQIRADLIRWLCVDVRARALVDPKGIQVYGAKISQTLDLSDVTVPFGVNFMRCHLADISLANMVIPELRFPGTVVSSMQASQVNVAHDVVLNDGFRSAGLLNLAGAKIGGSLNCAECKLSNPLRTGVPGSGIALMADNIDVNRNLVLHGASTDGGVALSYAQLGGVLDCSQATFNRPGGIAINADRLAVKGAIFFQALKANGAVQLQASQVGAQLVCRGSTLNNPGSVALNAEGISTTGGVFLDAGFHADGNINLNGAQIESNIECQEASFKGTLDIINANVGSNILLVESTFDGTVNLSGTQVGSNVNCTRALFNSDFIAERAVIKGTLLWMNRASSQVTLDLQGAFITSIHDDVKSWPQHGKLKLDGCAYKYFFGLKDSKSRLAWLSLMDPFAPQPYRQLADVLRNANDQSGAQSVLVEMERQQRARDWVEWPGSALLRWTIGYGYSPLRALGGLTVLTGLGWIIYRRAYLAGAMTPADQAAYQSYKQTGFAPEHYEHFSPGFYSLENSLPLVSFGQAAKWQPDPNPQRSANPHRGRLNQITTSSIFVRRFLWIQILLGWILATLFAAGVAGIIRSQ